MRIGQLAAQTGYSVRTIRFYEQCGILPTPERLPSGYRSYDQDAVTRLRFVRSAQTFGLSLAEIGEVLRIRDYQGPLPTRPGLLPDRGQRLNKRRRIRAMTATIPSDGGRNRVA
jgi:MerR family transcriptional regulator, copper efflux regulator